MKPDNFEDISAVSALYRPGPMGMNSHNNYADCARTAARDHPDPPRAGGAAGRGPGRHLRPDRLPGAGADGRADDRRLLARQGRHPAPRHGQEEERRSGEELRPLRGRACGRTATATRRSRPCGTCWSRSPATRSTRRTPPRTAWSSYWTAYLKANYPAEYMAALLTSVKDDKDKSALYLNECRRMGIKVLPPNVNESAANFAAGRHVTPLRPRRGAQRRHQRGRVDHHEPQGQGRVHLLLRLPAQGPVTSSATSAPPSR